MNSLERIIEDGGCQFVECEECALYTKGIGCELNTKITRKTGSVEKFSLAEMKYVMSKLEKAKGAPNNRWDA